MGKVSKKEELRQKARASKNPNTILWVFDLRVAGTLFQHGINASRAARLSDKQLLKLEGIGPYAVFAIRRAAEWARDSVLS